MLKELKKKSLKKKLPPILIGLAAAAALLWFSGFGFFSALQGPKDLYSIPADQLEGQYVEASVEIIYGQYAYTESRNTSTNRSTIIRKEYLIDSDADHYIGMEVDTDLIRAADALLDEETLEPLVVRGTVQRMDEETLGFYHDAVEYDDWTAEGQEMFLPLVLKVGYIGKMDAPVMWVMTAGAAVGLIVAAWLLLFTLSGGYQSSIKAYCRASESPSATMEQLDAFYESTQPVNGVRMGQWILFESNGKDILLGAGDVAWAYLRTVQHRTNGIPTGKTYGVVIRTPKKKKYEITMRDEASAREVMEVIAREMPRAVLGYTAALEQLYNKRINDFLRLPDDEALRAQVFGSN